MASGPAELSRRQFAEELAETLRLAVPIALTQLGQIAMMTTDLALIGRLGDAAVAAAALASTVLLHQFHVRNGAGVGGGAACRPGVRRPRPASGAALAADRPLGRVADFAADHDVSAVRRADPAGAGPGARHRASGAAISVRTGLGHYPGAVVSGDPRLHGGGQPAGAGTVDHAGRDPGQRAAGLSADPWRVGPAAARAVRRRPRHHDCQFRHASSRASGLRRAAGRSGNITC